MKTSNSTQYVLLWATVAQTLDTHLVLSPPGSFRQTSWSLVSTRCTASPCCPRICRRRWKPSQHCPCSQSTAVGQASRSSYSDWMKTLFDHDSIGFVCLWAFELINRPLNYFFLSYDDQRNELPIKGRMPPQPKHHSDTGPIRARAYQSVPKCNTCQEANFELYTESISLLNEMKKCIYQS